MVNAPHHDHDTSITSPMTSNFDDASTRRRRRQASQYACVHPALTRTHTAYSMINDQNMYSRFGRKVATADDGWFLYCDCGRTRRSRSSSRRLCDPRGASRVGWKISGRRVAHFGSEASPPSIDQGRRRKTSSETNMVSNAAVSDRN